MAFWKKIFKSKYTGAEIDAAVAKAGTVPAVTSADAGKALVVDEEGKIVPGEAGGGSTVIKADCAFTMAGTTLSYSCETGEIYETEAEALAAIDNLGARILQGENIIFDCEVKSTSTAMLVPVGTHFVVYFGASIGNASKVCSVYIFAPSKADKTDWAVVQAALSAHALADDTYTLGFNLSYTMTM